MGKFELEPNLSESQITRIWQNVSHREKLFTKNGEQIRVVYPGRTNDDDRGADFRDAVISTKEGLIKGDVEVHVKSSNWQAHHHHFDPVYNRVILHVVWRDDMKSATRLNDGRGIPVLVLDKFTRYPAILKSNSLEVTKHCLKPTNDMATGIISQFLDAAGKERFLSKAARFHVDITQLGAGQALYQGIMSALGYARNKLPFLELASRLPLRILEAQDAAPDYEYLARQQARLLGTAGLLPSQHHRRQQKSRSPDEWTGQLEKLCSPSHQANAMSSDDWNLFKVRPNNSPIRRILAMSHLLLRCREKGLLETIITLVKELPGSKSYRQLEGAFRVTANDNRISYTRNSALIGSRRAADMVVNVILPFTVAWSRLATLPELEDKALSLYNNSPSLAANAVEKHMRRQLRLSHGIVNSARRQQGLIHIYKILCTQGKCKRCPLYRTPEPKTSAKPSHPSTTEILSGRRTQP